MGVIQGVQSVELTTVFRREPLIPCSGLAIKGNASSSYIPSDRMHIQRIYWSRSGNDTTLKLWGIGTDYGLTIASDYGRIADRAAVFDVVFPLGF